MKYAVTFREKKMFLCHKKAEIRIRVLFKELDPDPYIAYTGPDPDLEHCVDCALSLKMGYSKCRL